MTGLDRDTSKSPDRTGVCCTGRCAPSQCETITGPSFSSLNKPDQERTPAYRDSSGSESPSGCLLCYFFRRLGGAIWGIPVQSFSPSVWAAAGEDRAIFFQYQAFYFIVLWAVAYLLIFRSSGSGLRNLLLAGFFSPAQSCFIQRVLSTSRLWLLRYSSSFADQKHLAKTPLSSLAAS